MLSCVISLSDFKTTYGDITDIGKLVDMEANTLADCIRCWLPSKGHVLRKPFIVALMGRLSKEVKTTNSKLNGCVTIGDSLIKAKYDYFKKINRSMSKFYKHDYLDSTIKEKLCMFRGKYALPVCMYALDMIAMYINQYLSTFDNPKLVEAILLKLFNKYGIA